MLFLARSWFPFKSTGTSTVKFLTNTHCMTESIAKIKASLTGRTIVYNLENIVLNTWITTKNQGRSGETISNRDLLPD